MSKKSRTFPSHPGGRRGKPPRWLLSSPGSTWSWSRGCDALSATSGQGPYGSTTISHGPGRSELVRMPLEDALDQLLEDLLADQLGHGPCVHRSEPYCVACTMEYIDAIFQGTPELAGLKAVAAMQRLSGHPSVARLAGYPHLLQCHAHHVGTDTRRAVPADRTPRPLSDLAP